jgi:mannan endo-1,4-beta-mannosidase
MSSGNIDSSATHEVKELLKNLQSQFGWYYLSGQQDPNSLAWVVQNIGKTPTMLGNDFIDYSPSRVAYGASSHAVEDAMSFDKKGGIDAFVWHWNAPTSLYNSASEPWYSGFYMAATCFNLQEALNEGTNGANYKLLIRDIDAIAVEIKRLSDAKIPILFRPLHEPDGGWFWWGAHGSAPFKQLWDILYSRIVNYHAYTTRSGYATP